MRKNRSLNFFQENLIRFFLFPVYSIDIADNILFSSDGRHIITWNLQTFSMLVKTLCFESGHIQEVKVLNPSLNNVLLNYYEDYILVTRSNRQLKVSL